MLSTKRALMVPLFTMATLGVAAACGGSNSEVATTNDAGGDSAVVDAGRDDADPNSDGGDTGPPPAALVSGQVVLHGVTTDDHAVYTRITTQARSLETIRLSDHVVTVLDAALPEDASIGVKGNIVAVWTNIDNATALGTLSYGTVEGPLRKNVATQSPRDLFWATKNGARAAFLANATVASGKAADAELLIGTTTAESTVLTATERVALDIASCNPRVGFEADTLIAAYCAPASTSARLVTFASTPSATRALLVDGGLTPFWSASAAGTKIFVISKDEHQARVVTNDGTTPAPSTPIEPDVNEGFILRDGGAVIYRAGTTLRRAALGGAIAPVTVATGEARRILDVSFDQSSILYHALPGKPVLGTEPDGERFVDLLTIPTTAESTAPRVLVPTERALPLGLSADGAHAIYFSSGPKLNAVATDGSGERSMSAAFNILNTTPSGSAAVLSTNVRVVGTKTVGDLVFADFSSGSAGAPTLTPLVLEVPSAGFYFGSAASNKLVYVRVTGDTPGLYELTLP